MSLLKLAHVSAFYGPSQALFDVHLDIAEGEVLALMGRNGMGKSTTVKVICRLLRRIAAGRSCSTGRIWGRCPRTRPRAPGSGSCRRGGAASRRLPCMRT